METHKILIVDDEQELALLLRDYFIKEGFETILAFDGEQGLTLFRRHLPTLVILDIMLPKIDGMELCRIIRNQSTVPVLMVSAKSSDADKILSLGLGADDYITKPFSPGELVARVKAQIRRYTLLSSPIKADEWLKFNQLEIDGKGYRVFLKSKQIDLASKEFELLRYLASHPQQVFTREQIFSAVWGQYEYGDINTVTVHISKIREKIEENPSKPSFIKTVWGVGYKFDGGS